MLILVYVIPSALSLFTPFVSGFIAALILSPLVTKIQDKLGASRRLLSLVFILLAFFSIAVLLVWFINTLIVQMLSLAANYQAILDYTISSFKRINETIVKGLEFLPGDSEESLANILDSLLLWLQVISKQFADYILSNTMTITTKISSSFLFVLMFIMSTYFITIDFPKIDVIVKRHTSEGIYNKLHVMKDILKAAVGGYFKAELFIALLAFAVMFIALTIYGQSYAFLIAFLLGVIDFLPVIGTAIVLVPWGVFCIISGDIGKGLFLLILAVSFFLLRRIVEPKIMGSQTGLSPLLSLMSIYVGMQLASVWGMILGPIVVMTAINIYKTGVFDNGIKDMKLVFHDIRSIFINENQ